MKLRKKILGCFLVVSCMLVFATSVGAASYNYGSSIISTKLRASSYTSSTNDAVKVSATFYYVLSNGTSIGNSTLANSANKSVASVQMSSGGNIKYFTKVNGVHTVGKNTYKSSAQ